MKSIELRLGLVLDVLLRWLILNGFKGYPHWGLNHGPILVYAEEYHLGCHVDECHEYEVDDDQSHNELSLIVVSAALFFLAEHKTGNKSKDRQYDEIPHDDPPVLLIGLNCGGLVFDKQEPGECEDEELEYVEGNEDGDFGGAEELE